MEQTFALCLHQYVRFATQKLGLSAPLTIEGGASGVKNFLLYMPSKYAPDDAWGPVLQDQISCKEMLRSPDPEDVDRVLLKIFCKLFDAAGHHRPEKLYNFPGIRPGTVPGH